MATEIRFPKFGLTMTRGTFLRWFKNEGERVQKGEKLFEIESDKSVMEVEAQVGGVLIRTLVEPDAVVPVGQVIGWLAESEEEATARNQPVSSVEEERSGGERIKASPVARRLAEKAGLELSLIQGSGPEGRIVREDVERAIATQTNEDEPARIAAVAADIIPLAGMRRTTAERMAASAHETARVTLIAEADATELVGLRTDLVAQTEGLGKAAPSYNDLLILIVARALKEHPNLNSRLAENEIHVIKQINVGLAVETEKGLLVPVIRNADCLGLEAIAVETQRLIGQARQGRLSPDDLSGGTFTITNLGVYGITAFTPIINPPEAAILGVGQIAQKPVVCKGEIVVRSLVALCLTFDHRLIDGAPAARFLSRIRQLLERPALLLL